MSQQKENLVNILNARLSTVQSACATINHDIIDIAGVINELQKINDAEIVEITKGKKDECNKSNRSGR